MKFPVLWSGFCCYTEGWGGKCSEILATIKLLYNPRVNKVFTSLHFSLNQLTLLPSPFHHHCLLVVHAGKGCPVQGGIYIYIKIKIRWSITAKTLNYLINVHKRHVEPLTNPGQTFSICIPTCTFPHSRKLRKMFMNTCLCTNINHLMHID